MLCNERIVAADRLSHRVQGFRDKTRLELTSDSLESVWKRARWLDIVTGTFVFPVALASHSRIQESSHVPVKIELSHGVRCQPDWRNSCPC